MTEEEPRTSSLSSLLPHLPSFYHSSHADRTLSVSLFNVLSLTLFLSLFALLLAVIVRAVHLYSYRRSHAPPTFPGLQVLGLFGLLWEKKMSLSSIPQLKDWGHAQLGKVYSIFTPVSFLIKHWYQVDPVVYQIADPEIVREIVSNKSLFLQQRTKESRGFQFNLIKDGLIGLPMGDDWMRHRRLLSPLFSERFLQIYHLGVMEEAGRLRERWLSLLQPKVGEGHAEKEEEGAVIDVSRDLTHLTLDVIGRVGFGVEFNALQDPLSPYSEAGKWVLRAVIRGGLPSWVSFFDRNGNKKCEEGVKVYQEMLQQVVAQKMKEYEAGIRPERDNFVTVLLRAQEETGEKEPLSPEAIRAEMLTMLIAGHETTANTLSWCLYLLAKYPEKQTKLRSELVKVLPTQETDVSFSLLSKMDYVKACFYEAMRVYPTVPSIPRVVAKDCTVGGYEFKAGNMIVVNNTFMAADPDNWDLPQAFEPERFLQREGEGERDRDEERGVKSPETAGNVPFAFLPFGAGPRSCIGKRFAVNEGLAILAVIVRNFQVEIAEEGEPVAHSALTMFPRDGIRLRVNPVKD